MLVPTDTFTYSENKLKGARLCMTSKPKNKKRKVSKFVLSSQLTGGGVPYMRLILYFIILLIQNMSKQTKKNKNPQ